MTDESHARIPTPTPVPSTAYYRGSGPARLLGGSAPRSTAALRASFPAISDYLLSESHE